MRPNIVTGNYSQLIFTVVFINMIILQHIHLTTAHLAVSTSSIYFHYYYDGDDDEGNNTLMIKIHFSLVKLSFC